MGRPNPILETLRIVVCMGRFMNLKKLYFSPFFSQSIQYSELLTLGLSHSADVRDYTL
jgi:hypothetical protein